ncbi:MULTISPECIES: nucleotidyltransferase family protein [unclassified Microcoleus]|uniref:nucleotidyltransferase family protein n=1 Tax=unclassified Microcoleus TaxID=2642155 RepID=UPI002FD7557F
MKSPIALPIEQITKFCQQWQIIELSLFGSVLHDNFHADSDIDILIAFAPIAKRGLLDHAQMQEELEALLSRRVDLISKRAIERSSNPIRRPEILSTAQTIGSQIVAVALPLYYNSNTNLCWSIFLCPCKSLKKKPANYQSAIALPC